MNKVNILGVKIDKVDLKEAIQIVDSWLTDRLTTHDSRLMTKKIIVTPNIEFILLAQTDSKFKDILNSADLSIPDSSHLGWAAYVQKSHNLFTRLTLFPLFLFPNAFFKFPTATGIDLMENLCKLAAQKGYSIGLLGGKNNTAKKAADHLKKKYPGLKISFAENGGEVNEYGVSGIRYQVSGMKTQKEKILNTQYLIPNTDILFVAFGHGKQEKWIQNYQDQVSSKVFMGVGGSFDYIGGLVPRAPKILQSLGLEWLFRLIMEPWRIKRQLGLLRFIGLVFLHRT